MNSNVLAYISENPITHTASSLENLANAFNNRLGKAFDPDAPIKHLYCTCHVFVIIKVKFNDCIDLKYYIAIQSADIKKLRRRTVLTRSCIRCQSLLHNSDGVNMSGFTDCGYVRWQKAAQQQTTKPTGCRKYKFKGGSFSRSSSQWQGGGGRGQLNTHL